VLAHDPQHSIVTTHIATAMEYDSTVIMLLFPRAANFQSGLCGTYGNVRFTIGSH